MESTLELYRTAIAGQPECADPAFSEWLRRYRAGDEAAGRELAGSCLGLALALAESFPDSPPGFTVLDLVQEANAGLVEALHTFTGATAGEFVDHARNTIAAWLNDLDDKQD
jgi:DNA-directed RNA polymerase specialized sigma subunit